MLWDYIGDITVPLSSRKGWKDGPSPTTLTIGDHKPLVLAVRRESFASTMDTWELHSETATCTSQRLRSLPMMFTGRLKEPLVMNGPESVSTFILASQNMTKNELRELRSLLETISATFPCIATLDLYVKNISSDTIQVCTPRL